MRIFEKPDRRNATSLRGAVLSVLVFAATVVGAQSPTPPSWGTAKLPSGPAQLHPAQSVTGQRRNETAGTLGSPPAPRDCRKAVTQADPGYLRQYSHAETNGYTSGSNVDLGFVLNTTRTIGNDEHLDHNDLQVRLEQLRCENQNIEAKLDYIIRNLH